MEIKEKPQDRDGPDYKGEPNKPPPHWIFVNPIQRRNPFREEVKLEARIVSRLQQRFRLARIFSQCAKIFACFAFVFVLFGWLNLLAGLQWGAGSTISFIKLADEQISVLNFLQPIMLIYAASICAAIYQSVSAQVERRGFIFLSVGFIILAAGEANFSFTVGDIYINSHGVYIHKMGELLPSSSPAALLAPLLLVPTISFLFCVKLLWRLPSRYAIWFMLCGATYVSGVLVVEILSQVAALDKGYGSLAYLLYASVEETLETIGIVGFCLAASTYLVEISPRVFDSKSFRP